MARDWEATFASWTGAEGTVEEGKVQQTLARVKSALSKSAALSAINTDVYAKGSYRNRTNVVRDSDIDVSVELLVIEHHEFAHQAAGMTIADFGLTPYSGSYQWQSFKDHVEQALVAEFGSALVERGNKAILVRPTSSTLPCDVVPCETAVQHISPTVSRRGVRITPDRGAAIVNYPKQHLEEGLAKNAATLKRYKRSVRILKRLENEMVANKVIEVVPSFLIESLVWNCNNITFANSGSWTGTIRSVIATAYQATESDEAAKDELEANNIKYLFHPAQKWTRVQASQFLVAAWNYVGF